MSTSRFALFVDLENCGAKAPTLNSILDKVKIRGDILLGKVYGYTDRFSDLKEVLLSNTFTVVPSIRYGYAQKNNADIMLVLDALEVAYTNPLIDSFCIVSGDSDYTPLVGRLKSMGKFVLGISRSEVASSIFINACNEFQFLETVSSSVSRNGKRVSRKPAKDEPLDAAGLNKLLEGILSEQTDEDDMYASELKGVLLRLRPDFNEKAFGCASFGKLLNKLAAQFGTIRVKNDNYNMLVSLNADAPDDAAGKRQLTPDTWRAAFTEQLQHYKDDGFERVNPSILKADIQAAYPDYSERAIGFKRFSDVLRQMEKEKLLALETDEQKNILVKML
ncbi:MAG: NYN domain-containing protein [Clostridia bacterium]|nr:NYN domain-containing protein [Clostridia bacterium]MCR4886450.1 NYN domain-containing protein [Clostridiales bacterium]